ncbi:MAG: hypothetical protein VB141_11280 [Burkholderia gladioli]
MERRRMQAETRGAFSPIALSALSTSLAIMLTSFVRDVDKLAARSRHKGIFPVALIAQKIYAKNVVIGRIVSRGCNVSP